MLRVVPCPRNIFGGARTNCIRTAYTSRKSGIIPRSQCRWNSQCLSCMAYTTPLSDSSIVEVRSLLVEPVPFPTIVQVGLPAPEPSLVPVVSLPTLPPAFRPTPLMPVEGLGLPAPVTLTLDRPLVAPPAPLPARVRAVPPAPIDTLAQASPAVPVPPRDPAAVPTSRTRTPAPSVAVPTAVPVRPLRQLAAPAAALW